MHVTFKGGWEDMKCFTCVHFWNYPPDSTSPYGEQACLEMDVDLYGVESVDVENCPDYKEKVASK